MVKAIGCTADIDTLGDILPIDNDSALVDLSSKISWNGRTHTQCFVDKGSKILTRIKSRAALDVISTRERRSNLLCELLLNLRAARKVEESSSCAGSSRVRASNNERLTLTKKLIFGVSLSSYGVHGLKEIMEEVFSAVSFGLVQYSSVVFDFCSLSEAFLDKVLPSTQGRGCGDSEELVETTRLEPYP